MHTIQYSQLNTLLCRPLSILRPTNPASHKLIFTYVWDFITLCHQIVDPPTPKHSFVHVISACGMALSIRKCIGNFEANSNQTTVGLHHWFPEDLGDEPLSHGIETDWAVGNLEKQQSQKKSMTVKLNSASRWSWFCVCLRLFWNVRALCLPVSWKPKFLERKFCCASSA